MSKKLLKSLSMAALALPAIASQASTVVDSVEMGVRYSKYQEDSLRPTDVSSGSLDRYDIDVVQFSFVAPLTDKFQLNLHYQEESLSGASPWYSTKVNGEVKEIMSGATIEEERKDVSAQLTYAGSNFSLSGLIGVSRENDYEANSIGAEVSYELPGKLTTVAFAGDLSFDKINPTPYSSNANGDNSRVEDEEKDSWSTHLSLSQIINKSLITQIGFGTIKHDGYLSDPYKLVNVAGTLIGDSRPDSRFATTVSARVRYFIDSINSTLHIDYRYYSDDWDVDSHTIDVAQYFNVGGGFQLVPSLRYYTQSEAFFYKDFHEEERFDGYYATDSRLSSFGAFTMGLKVNWQLKNWFLTAGYQRYISDQSYSFYDYNSESLSLVNFNLFTVGVDYKF